MFVEPENFYIWKWRYLDSFDSIRFSKSEFGEIQAPYPYQYRVKQASNEFLVALLMGNGIGVPNNQFVDSKGFIKIAANFIKSASEFSKSKKSVYLPITFAIFDYSSGGKKLLRDPYDLAAQIFNRNGKGSKKYFELSAWPELDKDLERREKWAEAIADKRFIGDDYVNDSEIRLLEDLYIILDYFYKENKKIIKAKPTRGIRETMTSSIARLDLDNVEESVFFSRKILEKHSDNLDAKTRKIKDIINVFKQIEEKGILDNRSAIRDNILNQDDLFKGIQDSIESISIGVLKTFNSIYNYSSYKSTRVQQDSQTEPMNLDEVWGYDEAAFALGQYAREAYEESIKGDKDLNDISSIQNSFISSEISDSIPESDENDKIWKSFFEYQRCEKYNTSVINYMRSLANFEKEKNEYDSLDENDKTSTLLENVMDKVKEYKEFREKHIELVNSMLPEENKIQYDEEGIAFLKRIDEKGNLISKIQIEDFAELPEFTRREIGGLLALELFKNITTKGKNAEYGESHSE